MDDSFLDSLGPKFKKLAEISLGIDDEAQPAQPPGGEGGPGAASWDSWEVQESESTSGQGLSGSQGASALSASGCVLQPAISIPDPGQQGSYMVTET